MGYASLEEFKTYLGISGTDKDVELTSFLNSAKLQLDKLIGDYSKGTTTEKIRKVSIGNYGVEIFLSKTPVLSINKINRVNFNYVEGVNYQIQNERKLIIKDSSIVSEYYKRGEIDVEYTHGYEVAPEDLKLAQMILACGYFNQKGTAGISSYRLGEETITYGLRSGEESFEVGSNLNSIIQKYKTFNLTRD